MHSLHTQTFFSFGTNFQATWPTDVGRCSLHNLCKTKEKMKRIKRLPLHSTISNVGDAKSFCQSLRYRRRNQHRFYLQRSSQLQLHGISVSVCV